MAISLRTGARYEPLKMGTEEARELTFSTALDLTGCTVRWELTDRMGGARVVLEEASLTGAGPDGSTFVVALTQQDTAAQGLYALHLTATDAGGDGVTIPGGLLEVAVTGPTRAYTLAYFLGKISEAATSAAQALAARVAAVNARDQSRTAALEAAAAADVAEGHAEDAAESATDAQHAAALGAAASTGFTYKVDAAADLPSGGGVANGQTGLVLGVSDPGAVYFRAAGAWVRKGRFVLDDADGFPTGVASGLPAKTQARPTHDSKFLQVVAGIVKRWGVSDILTPLHFRANDEPSGLTPKQKIDAAVARITALDLDEAQYGDAQIPKPRLVLDPIVGGWTYTGEIVLPSGVEVDCMSPVVFTPDGAGDLGFRIGTVGLSNKANFLRLRAERFEHAWVSGEVGINLVGGLFSADRVFLEASYFETGAWLNPMSSGFAHNIVSFGHFYGNKYGVTLGNTTDPNGEYANDNTFLGGNFSGAAPAGVTGAGATRYAVRILSDALNSGPDNNRWFGQSFQLGHGTPVGSEGIPVLIEQAAFDNHFYSPRMESSSPEFFFRILSGSRAHSNYAFDVAAYNGEGTYYDGSWHNGVDDQGAGLDRHNGVVRSKQRRQSTELAAFDFREDAYYAGELAGVAQVGVRGVRPHSSFATAAAGPVFPSTAGLAIRSDGLVHAFPNYFLLATIDTTRVRVFDLNVDAENWGVLVKLYDAAGAEITTQATLEAAVGRSPFYYNGGNAVMLRDTAAAAGALNIEIVDEDVESVEVYYYAGRTRRVTITTPQTNLGTTHFGVDAPRYVTPGAPRMHTPVSYGAPVRGVWRLGEHVASAAGGLLQGWRCTAGGGAVGGAWANATVYALDAWVSHGGAAYQCIAAHTAATATDAPGTGSSWATKWALRSSAVAAFETEDGALPLAAYTDSTTLTAADVALGGVVITKATGTALTLPTPASLGVRVGTVVQVEQGGAGAVTLSAGAGATIVSRGGLVITNGQHAVARLRASSSNTWRASGDLV